MHRTTDPRHERPHLVEARPRGEAFRSTGHAAHRNGDDLLTAGLGLEGLQQATPPAFADPAAPSAAERRRRAVWNSWRGIADLRPEGGYGALYGSTVAVPGQEFHALATVPGAHQPHRVMLQLPDAFDTRRRCLVVTASSGSRGIYGAIAVAGAWGLPKGCAVAYTDKGAGSDYFDLDAGQGIAGDGRVARRGDAVLAFDPGADAPATGIAFKHAHSQDNPEADWGRHLRQAAEFALATLDVAVPQGAPYTFENTRIIAVGISNGGGAVLRAAEDGDWLDAVVAGAPSIHIDAPGARALYDYTTEAALLMPCALADLEGLPQSPLSATARAMRAVRCSTLRAGRAVEGGDTVAQARSAHARMRACAMPAGPSPRFGPPRCRWISTCSARWPRPTHRPTAAIRPAPTPAVCRSRHRTRTSARVRPRPPSARPGGAMPAASHPAPASA